MRMIVVFTDDGAVPEIERALLAHPGHGFTVLAAAAGLGKSGFHAGDRVHPGGSSVVLSVVADEEREAVLALVREASDRAGAHERTRIFVAPIEEARSV